MRAEAQRICEEAGDSRELQRSLYVAREDGTAAELAEQLWRLGEQELAEAFERGRR